VAYMACPGDFKNNCKKRNAQLFICELGALFHDIADPKFMEEMIQNPHLSPRNFLQKQGLDNDTIFRVVEIIDNISYKGGQSNNIPSRSN